MLNNNDVSRKTCFNSQKLLKQSSVNCSIFFYVQTIINSRTNLTISPTPSLKPTKMMLHCINQTLVNLLTMLVGWIPSCSFGFFVSQPSFDYQTNMEMSTNFFHPWPEPNWVDVHGMNPPNQLGNCVGLVVSWLTIWLLEDSATGTTSRK